MRHYPQLRGICIPKGDGFTGYPNAEGQAAPALYREGLFSKPARNRDRRNEGVHGR